MSNDQKESNPFEPPKIDSKPQDNISILQAIRKRITWGVIAPTIAYVVWRIGVHCDNYGGAIDQLGAILCRLSTLAALILIPATCITSIGSRLNPSKCKWDLYGPALAVLLFLHILYETITNLKV
jgi:hypothetical protein